MHAQIRGRLPITYVAAAKKHGGRNQPTSRVTPIEAILLLYDEWHRYGNKRTSTTRSQTNYMHPRGRQRHNYGPKSVAKPREDLARNRIWTSSGFAMHPSALSDEPDLAMLGLGVLETASIKLETNPTTSTSRLGLFRPQSPQSSPQHHRTWQAKHHHHRHAGTVLCTSRHPMTTDEAKHRPRGLAGELILMKS